MKILNMNMMTIEAASTKMNSMVLKEVILIMVISMIVTRIGFMAMHPTMKTKMKIVMTNSTKATGVALMTKHSMVAT